MTPEWEETRRQVLRRDNYGCVACQCDLREDGAHVHHVLPRAAGGSDELANLISLCSMCHAAVHPGLGASLTRRLIEKVALRLAAWLDTEGRLALATRNFGPALRLFGLNAFRGPQLEVVEAALHKHSLLFVSPTGSGKSLTFQIPAVLTPGLCVVISPLKALMSDQVSGLMRRHIPATFINSDLSQKEKRLRGDMVRRSAYRFLYLAPERFFLAAKAERQLLDELRPAYLVIDEAHCIDRWGQDFRPEYGRLAEVRRRLGNPPVLALTATAGRKTQARILSSLGVPSAAVFVQGVDRPNIALLRLSVSVTQRHNMIASLLRLAECLDIKTMVFVPTRKISEELLRHLSAESLPAPFFHGQLDALVKDSLLQRFGGRLAPPLSRIVCTNAFGMGVDISDVRMVIHWQHPASAEDYLQELGRAGRDGRRSVAILLRDPHPDGPSVRLLDFMATRTAEAASELPDERGRLLNWRQTLVREMQSLAFSRDCFRRRLLDYFGGSRVRRRRSMALRIVDWLFSDRARRVERSLCCDVCDSRHSDYRHFVCDALGAKVPRSIIGS